MANAPQGNGGAHAEGGYTFSGDQPPDPNVTNRNNDGVSNRVQDADVRTVAPRDRSPQPADAPGPSGGNAALLPLS